MWMALSRAGIYIGYCIGQPTGKNTLLASPILRMCHHFSPRKKNSSCYHMTTMYKYIYIYRTAVCISTYERVLHNVTPVVLSFNTRLTHIQPKNKKYILFTNPYHRNEQNTYVSPPYPPRQKNNNAHAHPSPYPATTKQTNERPRLAKQQTPHCIMIN